MIATHDTIGTEYGMECVRNCPACAVEDSEGTAPDALASLSNRDLIDLTYVGEPDLEGDELDLPALP